jgi:hypothetical protein
MRPNQQEKYSSHLSLLWLALVAAIAFAVALWQDRREAERPVCLKPFGMDGGDVEPHCLPTEKTIHFH